VHFGDYRGPAGPLAIGIVPPMPGDSA